MLISVIAATSWISVLRKQVAVRTDALREANERLHRVAIEDGLTGAANRRRFDELLKNEVNRAIVQLEIIHQQQQSPLDLAR